MKQVIRLTEHELTKLVTESVKNIIESDRHREGYYRDYSERTGKKDRHSPDYYKKYRERKKLEQEQENNLDTSHSKENTSSKNKNKKDRHRPGYYHDYNTAHPERLERGFTKGYINGKTSNGKLDNNGVYIDDLGRLHNTDFYNPTLSDLIGDKERIWHDDDWCEDVD